MHLEFEEPHHRLLTFLGLCLCFGGATVLILALAGDLVRGIYVGGVLGCLMGSLGSRPKRWELDGDEFRQVYPKREAGQMRLPDVRSLEAVPRLKGGFDLWLVPVRGYKVAVPNGPGRRGDAFRGELFRRLPTGVLAQAKDPLILDLVASAARSADSG